MASTNTSRNHILPPSNLIPMRLTLGILRCTRKIQKLRYNPWLGGRSVTISITISSELTSITCGNPLFTPKTSNRQSDLLTPTNPGHELIATSTMADARFLSTFPTPLDGRCTIKSMGWITSCRNGEKSTSPHQMVGGFFYFRDPVECARYLLCHSPYKDHMV